MLQEIEEITSTKKKLKINIPSEVIKSEFDTAYNRLRATVRIPGFRPGKVPLALLEKKFGRDVNAQVMEKIIPEFYSKAIQEAKLEPVSYPSIEGEINLKPTEPLSFTVTVEVKPDVGEIKYEGLTLTEKTYSVEDNEIEKAINSLRENNAVYTVTEDGLTEGDMAIITCEAFIGDELKEELSYRDYPLIIGSEAMPKEFSDALLGKKQDEAVEVRLKFEETHPNRAVAGEEVLYKIVVNEAKKRNLPPLDDEFARNFDCDNLEELKKKIHDGISERKKSIINMEYKRELLNTLIKNHDFEVPLSMLERELDSLMLEAKYKAMRAGEPVKPDEELRKELESTARDNVKGVLILETIGKKAGIEVTEDDMRKAMKEMGDRNNLKPEEVTKLYMAKEGSMDALRSRLFADKVLDHILEKSTIVKEQKGEQN